MQECSKLHFLLVSARFDAFVRAGGCLSYKPTVKRVRGGRLSSSPTVKRVRGGRKGGLSAPHISHINREKGRPLCASGCLPFSHRWNRVRYTYVLEATGRHVQGGIYTGRLPTTTHREAYTPQRGSREPPNPGYTTIRGSREPPNPGY